MQIRRISAFTEGGAGGNPAGVVLADSLPSTSEMQRIAAEVGYSETVFAAPTPRGWTTRYFSPEAEVPFCGHATIALGAVLAVEKGNNWYGKDRLNHMGCVICTDQQLRWFESQSNHLDRA
jgi:PhzF family phenazine biosynthesis protein